MSRWLRYRRFYHYYMEHEARYQAFELLCTLLGYADIDELREQEVIPERLGWPYDPIAEARARRLAGYGE